MQKELDGAKSATSSMEASKDALEAELQQQKDALASLEEKMQEQKQLAEAQQEAKVALEAKLQETFASETALKSELEATNEASSALEAKFLESQALETSLTRELQESKEAEAASIQLKNQLMSQLQNADERVSTLTVDLTAAQDGTPYCCDFMAVFLCSCNPPLGKLTLCEMSLQNTPFGRTCL